MSNNTRLSKFFSMVLRHRASEFGIELDAEGYTDLGALYEVMQKRYRNAYTYNDMIHVLLNPGSDGKARFEVKNEQVRAKYGHSDVSKVKYPPAEPPELLYHGTSTKYLDAIKTHGLKPMKRQYVHLTIAPEEALIVGRRQGKPILLHIRALEAHQDGAVFYQPDDKHYLVAAIPPKYITFPDTES